MSKIDEVTISRYLDGALSYERSNELASRLEQDEQGRELALDYLKAHVLLKSCGREILEEKIPAQLTSTLRESGSEAKGKRSRFLLPFLQVGVAVVILFFGYYAGQFKAYSPALVSTAFPMIPVELEATVNDVLEYEKSGTSHIWKDTHARVTATVMPVKTYRDKSGGFYRFYFIDLHQSGLDRQLAGVAYRTEKKQWQTRSVFFRDGNQKTSSL